MSPPIRFDSAEFAENDAEEIWREGIDAIFEIKRPNVASAPFRAKFMAAPEHSISISR